MSIPPFQPYKPMRYAKTPTGNLTALKSGFDRQAPVTQAVASSQVTLDAKNRMKRSELLDKLSKAQKSLDVMTNDTLTNHVTIPAVQAGKVMAKTAYSKIATSTSQLKTAAIGVDVVEIRRALDFMSEIPAKIWAKLDGIQSLITTVRSQSHTINYVIGRFMEELSALQDLLSQALAQLGELMKSLYNWVKGQLHKVRLPARISNALVKIESWISTVSQMLPKLWSGVKKFFGPLKELLGPLSIFIDEFQIDVRVDTYNADPTGTNFDKLAIDVLGLVVDLVMWGVPAVCTVLLIPMPPWILGALVVYAIVNTIYAFAVDDAQDMLATAVYRIVESIVNVAKNACRQITALGQQVGTWAENLYETNKARLEAWIEAQKTAAFNWVRKQGQSAIDSVEGRAKEAWQKLQFPLPNL